MNACGLNGDWNCEAWHFGPGPVANKTSGDVYVLDNEDGAPAAWANDTEAVPSTYAVVRRYYVDGDNDIIETLCDGLSFERACEMARDVVAALGG